MNSRQRFLAALSFQPVDQVPLPCLFQQFEAETLKRWQREGLPRDVHTEQHFGFERMELVPANLGLLPGGDLDDAEQAQEWRVGADRGHTGDEVTQQSRHLKESYPLHGREGWAEWRKRLNPASPARYPRFWDDYARHRQERDYPLGIAFPGPITALRDWVGPSGLARALAGDRAWVEEMVEYLSEFGVAASARALRDLPLDFAIIRERSGYQAPLLGMGNGLEQLLKPCYRRWSEALEKAGITVRLVEAPGNVASLIPLWLESGLNALAYVESSAGLDGRALRAQYGRSLALVGNVDQQALTLKWRDIADELNGKAQELLAAGGYIPTPDRPVSSEVPLENYEYYLATLKRMGGA